MKKYSNTLNIWLLSILLTFMSQVQTSAQYVTSEFEHLSTRNGLSQSTVTAILQDSRGYLWIGTKDGLNRYDGYGFKIFRNNPKDKFSLSDNSITSIAEDVFGDIWIGTLEGYINRYSYETGKITSYKLIIHPLYSDKHSDSQSPPSCFSYYKSNTITALLCDKYDNLWVGTWGKGLFRFDLNNEKFVDHFYSESEENPISSDFITSLVQDNDGRLFVSTFGGGLNEIIKNEHNANNSASAYLIIRKKLPIDNKITSLQVDSKNDKLWAGTFGSGLFSCTLSQIDSAKCIYTNMLPGENILRLIRDQDSTLWIGTIGDGLYQYSPSKKLLKNFQNNPVDQNTIDDNDVIALACDRSNLIWIGTSSGFGVNKLHPSLLKFNSYSMNPLQKNNLNNNIITCFTEDKNGNIWIGTYKGGVNKFDRTKKIFEVYTASEKENSLSSNNITSICCDNDNNIWVGTYDAGLNLIQTGKGRIVRFNNEKALKDYNNITSIVTDHPGAIWIGTLNKGLLAATAKDGKYNFTRYVSDTLYAGSLSDNRISLVYTDKDGVLWVSVSNGDLFRRNESNDQFERYKIFKEGFEKEIRVNSLYDDGAGNLWIGTNGNGLLRFVKGTGEVHRQKIYKENIITGIAGDQRNNLWISSYNGITRYSYKNKSICQFNLNDGLKSLQFNNGAVLTSRNGEIFFGGVSGFNSFFPDSIKLSRVIPEIRITSVQCSGNTLENIPDWLTIPSGNSIRFEFSSFDFVDPSKNQYFYKLSEYDTSWTLITDGNNYAYYQNLPPGAYVFTVRGSNNSGLWSRNQAAIKFNVSLPFWKSIWFLSLIILVIAGIISLYIRNRITQFMEVVNLKQKISADLHDTVGSGLTEISLMSELMIKKDSKDENIAKIKIINERARELIDSMSDIVWLVNPKPDSLYDLVLRLKDIYSLLFECQSIKFKIVDLELLQDLKLTMLQRQNIYLIFKEAINNSLKYSRCKNISLLLKISGSNLEVILKDDGKGFIRDKVFAGNGLKNMQKRSQLLKGNLEILSFPGEGTEITLRCRI